MKNLRLMLMCSCFALALAPLPVAAETALVYVTNSAGDHVDVINPLTNKVVQQFPIIGAHGVNFAPDGSRVYISNEQTSTLDVFEQKTGKLMKKVKLSYHPNNIAVAKDGRILVGIARGAGALDIIDPVQLEVKKTIPTQGGLHNIYTTADGKFVINGSAKRVFVQMAAWDGFGVLDFATHRELARVKLPDLHTGVDMDPGREDAPSHGIGVSPDRKTLWVTSIPQNAVFVYDLAAPMSDDMKPIDTIKLPDLKIAGRKDYGG